MTEFWLISAPGEKTCQQTWEKLHAATTKNNNLSTNSKFNIPDLKVCKPHVTSQEVWLFCTIFVSLDLNCRWGILADVLERTVDFFWRLCVDLKNNSDIYLFFWNSKLKIPHSGSFKDSTSCVLSERQQFFQQ